MVVPARSTGASTSAGSSVQGSMKNDTLGESQVTGKDDNQEGDAKGDTAKGMSTNKKATFDLKLTPRLILEYVNAGLLMKEYNLRQNRRSPSLNGSPEKSKAAATTKENGSPEKSKDAKRKRPLELDGSPERKKTKLSMAQSTEAPSTTLSNSGVSELSSDATQLSSITIALPADSSPHKHDRSKPSMRRKASLQRKKSQSQKRPHVDGIDTGGNKADIMVCAFCHQRDGAVNLGFLYGPYKSTPSSDNLNQQVQNVPVSKDTDKKEEGDHLNELWVHEDCAVWTPGVCLVGGQLIGLREAATDGGKMVSTLLSS